MFPAPGQEDRVSCTIDFMAILQYRFYGSIALLARNIDCKRLEAIRTYADEPSALLVSKLGGRSIRELDVSLVAIQRSYYRTLMKITEESPAKMVSDFLVGENLSRRAAI